MPIPKIVEYTLGRLLLNLKEHDEKLFIKRPAFVNFPEPTISVDCPTVGPSNSHLPIDYVNEGIGEKDQFPELNWSFRPSESAQVEEYLLLCEDPDSPIPRPPAHGLYCCIPATKTEISPGDMAVDTIEKKTGTKLLKGGFRVGKGYKDRVYVGPRPPCGHGPHRYFYEVVALKKKIGVTKLSAVPTRDEIGQAIQGNVAGWGVWVGIFERKW